MLMYVRKINVDSAVIQEPYFGQNVDNKTDNHPLS